jgi:hypothetical protein
MTRGEDTQGSVVGQTRAAEFEWAVTGMTTVTGFELGYRRVVACESRLGFCVRRVDRLAARAILFNGE